MIDSPESLRQQIYEGCFPRFSDKPTVLERLWRKRFARFEHINQPNILHTPVDCIPIANPSFRVLRDEKAVATSWNVVFPNIDMPGNKSAVPIVRIKDAEGIVRGYETIKFNKLEEFEKHLSPEDVERVHLYYDVSTIIMGGADGYSVAEVLTRRFINHDYQQIQHIDDLFDEKSYPEIKTLFEKHPDQILTYLIHTIVETHMIDPKNTPPEMLSKLESLRKVLRETNPSSIATNDTNLETNINDAMVYLQELWISRAYPHLFAVGNEVVARKTGLAHEKRFCTLWTTRLMDRALNKAGIIDWNDESFTIRGNFKSGSSLLLAILSEQQDFRDSVFQTLSHFGIDISHIQKMSSPMDQTIALLDPLEKVIIQELANPSKHVLTVQNLIEDLRDRMNDKEYFVRCYAMSDDNDRLQLALEHGKATVDAFKDMPKKKGTNIDMWANCVMKRKDKGFRQAFSYDEIQKIYESLPKELQRYASVWFLLDHIYQIPIDGTGFAMWYVHLPTVMRTIQGNKQLHILSPKELRIRKKKDILWMEMELGTDLNALPGNWTRSAWEYRSRFLHEGSMPDNIKELILKIQELARKRDKRPPDHQKQIPIPDEFYAQE